jgi:hypothetical protein
MECYSKRHRNYSREFREKNLEKNRKIRTDSARRTKFGLSPDEIDAILASQGGVCAICKKQETALGTTGQLKRMSVDHCHKSGIIRGVLCNACNLTLGNAKDDIARLRGCVGYLERFLGLT